MSSAKIKSAVIFGGSGFIGLHLAERLAGQGICVTVADKKAPPGFCGRRSRKLDFKKVDLAKTKDLKSILRGKRYCLNLAASLPFSTGNKDYLRESIDVNIKGAVNIAEACLEAGVDKLIFASGYTVYGKPRYLPIDENHPTNPIGLYGASKLAAEKYLQVLCRNRLPERM